MNKKQLNQMSLKYNPFSPEVPVESLFIPPRLESLYWRIENAHLREGGFALLTGEPGTGKSAALRALADRLGRIPDVQVGVLSHPSSNVADFYRELGDLFSVPLRPHNRWCGFKALREAWQNHIEATLMRPLLLIDEAQEMTSATLSELRLLSSTRFDSRIVLAVVLAGDARLGHKLREDLLAPIASRIRVRLAFEPLSPAELAEHLRHLLAAAGNPELMTPALIGAICDHSAGNLRAMSHLAAELLAGAVQKNLDRLDEKLFLEMAALSRPGSSAPRAPLAARRR